MCTVTEDAPDICIFFILNLGMSAGKRHILIVDDEPFRDRLDKGTKVIIKSAEVLDPIC